MPKAGATCAASARSSSVATGSVRSGTTRCRRWRATSSTASRPWGSTWRSARSSGPCSTSTHDRTWPPAPSCCGSCATCCRTTPYARSWARADSASARSRRAGTWRSAATSARSSSSGTRASPSSRCSNSASAGPCRASAPPPPSRSTRSSSPSSTSAAAGFTDELGARAVELLSAERTVDDAPEVLRRMRRLLGHYRATRPALPRWCEAFVTTGYAHYCTLLPTAFTDDDSGVRQVAAMLGFLFGMESLALSFGCAHAQLELAVRQSHPEAAGEGRAAVGGELPARPAVPGRPALPLRRPAGQPARRAGCSRSTSAGSSRRWSRFRR